MTGGGMEMHASGRGCQIESLSSSDYRSRTKSRLPVLSRSPSAGNAELPHPVLQRGTLQAESGRGAVGSGDSPMRRLENTQNLLAFAFINRSSGIPRVGNLQFAVFSMTAGRMVTGLEVRSRYVQHGPRGYDHGAFDHIL